MFARYLVTISPAENPEDLQPAAAGHRLSFRLPRCHVTIASPDSRPDAALKISWQDSPGRLTITEGSVIDTGTPDLLQSGTYNRLTVDEAGEARLSNDTFGLMKAYYAQDGGVVRISNSLRLLQASAGLSHDELGIAETFLFGGWTPNDRTILAGGKRLIPGAEYCFVAGSGRPPEIRRLTGAWTTVHEDRVETAVVRVIDLWEAALARHFDSANRPVGLLLSGGLDSRMVAGGVEARGKQLIGLTFGDLGSDEVRIAGQVARASGAKWIPSGLDASFPFERLAFERINLLFETAYNLIWDANAPLLAAEGVGRFTTGATFETTFGGQRDAHSSYLRLARNVRNALVGPWKSRPANGREREGLIDLLMEKARRRDRNYSKMLAEPFRSMVRESLSKISEEVTARVTEIVEAGPISIGQAWERFDSENYQTQYSRDQERQLLAYGALALPTCDRDLANYLTNLPAGLKYDHALYYRVLRRLYPHLAAIPVPNLGTGINKHQLRIELERAWRIRRKSRLTTWVNFHNWMNSGSNLAKYEQLFLENDHFFDPDAVRAYFADVRAERQNLYDGGETTGFLNLAMLLDKDRL